MSRTGWELPILKLMGRKIVLHYRGCEGRSPDKNQELHPEMNICQKCDYDRWVCREGKKRVERIRKYADISLVTTPDLKDFLPKATHFPFFCPDIDYEKYAWQGTVNEEIKIVHITNHPGIEGTDDIKRAIDSLKTKGYKINFVFLRGVTPEKALEEYKSADIGIGKMKMGYYANAQIESMFCGVPTITYVRPEFMTPELKDSGFIFTHLNDLEKTLEHYLKHPEELAEKRKNARASILRIHDNETLARQLIVLYGMKPSSVSDEAHSVGKRPLRVLHIGNLANNAYYNAKFLRREGIEADVLCYDNYWVMSSPEWEEADFGDIPDDHQFPNWWALDLKGYQRPRWFAQGPFELCVRYLIAKQKKDNGESKRSWELLERTRRIICSKPYARAFNVARSLKRAVPFLGNIRKAAERLNDANKVDSLFHDEYAGRCKYLINEFEKYFPDRPDKLTLEDFAQYENNVGLLKELFRYYDVVHGYATDALYPMLAGFRPYVAFEHGTLRDSPEINWAYKGPFYDAPISRLTALSYAMADHVFVTNADCLSSAKRLGIKSFEPAPHPLDEDSFSCKGEDRELLRSKLGQELIFFCPIRHDWLEKGVDKYIEAIPLLRDALKKKFKVFFTPWGKEVGRSRRRISDLRCDDLVEWVGPFGRVDFVKWLSASDVIFDQVIYPSFSGLTPRALSCGVPIIASYDHSSMKWMFPEPPPILSAKTVDEIVSRVKVAVSGQFRDSYRKRAREWVEKYHSSSVSLTKMSQAHEKVGLYIRDSKRCENR
jgi:Glycosyltransferase